MEIFGFTIPAAVIAIAVVQFVKWIGEERNKSNCSNSSAIQKPQQGTNTQMPQIGTDNSIQLTSKKCLSCSTLNPIDAKFCRSCGGASLVNNYEKKNK